MATQQTRPPVLADIYGSTGDLLGGVVGAFHATGFPQASPPFRRGFNASLNHIDKVATYLLQGMSELTVGETYAINRVMLSTINYQLYRSKLNQTYATNDELDPAKWELYLGANPIHKHADYNATTNTPDIADINNNGLYIVTTAGFVSGVSIQGALTTGGSYLMVDDIVFNNNGNLELFRSEIIGSQSLDFGTGTFSTLRAANDYINQRLYTELTLNQTSNTVETATIEVTNNCGGDLTILSNGFTVDLSGTANTHCILSGINIEIDGFSVKANDIDQALLVNGHITHDNGLSVENIGTGWGIRKGDSAVLRSKQLSGFSGISATANIVITCAAVGNISYSAQGAGFFSCNNLNTNSFVHLGTSTSTYIAGSVTTGGGAFNSGNTSSFFIAGSVTTGGGQFYGGNTSSYRIDGSVTTGGGAFNSGTGGSGIVSNNVIGAVGATFILDGTTMRIGGNVTGYTVAGAQIGRAIYDGATSAGVLRNQNSNTLMAN